MQVNEFHEVMQAMHMAVAHASERARHIQSNLEFLWNASHRSGHSKETKADLRGMEGPVLPVMLLTVCARWQPRSQTPPSPVR